MAGIYIHIPFCKQACTYCNFHFSTSLKLKEELVNCICREIEFQKDYLRNEIIETIYFGGGTPSLLAEAELRNILNTLNNNFEIAPNVELTLEANPDDINDKNLEIFAENGINRLSIGIQSFFEEDLRFMNRAHTAKEAIASLELALKAGIDNLNIDLIYGTPSLTDHNWLHNLKMLTELGIPHLSAYQLTVEPGTALASHIKKGKIPPLPEQRAVHQFEMLMDWADRTGFEHYEISNLSMPGMRSRHNTSYWSGLPYLGIGPAAHSFKGNERRWNIANNAIYIRTVNSGDLPVEQTEVLEVKDRYNEYIMTGLRRIEGVDLTRISSFGSEYRSIFTEGILPFVANGQVEQLNTNTYRLTGTGKIFADRIASECFAV